MFDKANKTLMLSANGDPRNNWFDKHHIGGNGVIKLMTDNINPSMNLFYSEPLYGAHYFKIHTIHSHSQIYNTLDVCLQIVRSYKNEWDRVVH